MSVGPQEPPGGELKFLFNTEFVYASFGLKKWMNGLLVGRHRLIFGGNEAYRFQEVF